MLLLKVGEGGDGVNFDHADWADAKFEMAGRRPPPLMRRPKKLSFSRLPRAQGRPSTARGFSAPSGDPLLFTFPPLATGP